MSLNLTPEQIASFNSGIKNTYDMASAVQRDLDEQNKKTRKMAEEAYKTRQRELHALEETAANTSEANKRLETVIDNQNKHIDLLEKQLEVDEKQLRVLRNIFASGEDGVAVEKEIMKMIRDQIDDKHPLWDYVKDKGGDIAVAGVTAGVPVIYKAIKNYLQTRGIMLP